MTKISNLEKENIQLKKKINSLSYDRFCQDNLGNRWAGANDFIPPYPEFWNAGGELDKIWNMLRKLDKK